MNKIGAVTIVIVAVALTYLVLLVVMPIYTELATTANTTMNATSNMSLYPGTSELMMSSSWIMFFVPAVIGIALIVVILRLPSGE